jgi:hypothetical protein
MSSTTETPDTRDLAERLGVDGELLVAFVRSHPEPTAPIVLGWATSAGRPRAEPDDLRDDVAAWLDARARGEGE